MKLEKVLNQLNSLEKNAFLKIIDNIISDEPKNKAEIDRILEGDEQLKNTDNANLARIFSLVSGEFLEVIDYEFSSAASQLDILIDIIIRDGNCIMSREWLASLYSLQIKNLKQKVKEFEKSLSSDAEVDIARPRDYKVYKKCIEVAYHNDEENNLEQKITRDEQAILKVLSLGLGLSQEEVRLLNYMVLPLEKQDIDKVIQDLKTMGVIFYQKKTLQLYVPDEIISCLRVYRGKAIADKYFRRIMTHFKDSQLNLISKKHGIDRKLPRLDKIKEIINQGINFSDVLLHDIYRDGTSQTDIKNFLNDLMFSKLGIVSDNKGKTAEEKVGLIIDHFTEMEKDPKLDISYHGYEKLLLDIEKSLPKINNHVREEFQIQDERVLKSDLLLDYAIKPRDVLYIMDNDELMEFCNLHGIKTRGDIVDNILAFYRDSDSLLLENYEKIARRDNKSLKESGIGIKEADLGIKFEELTKSIFTALGFDVDDELRKNLNSSKHKIDLIIRIQPNEIIIVECKTNKDKGYNKYSSVSRQIKSYIDLAERAGYRVIKSLLIAPEFSDDFEKECGLEYELNLSLITSSSLKTILDGFIESKHTTFPYKLLLRDVVIKEDRILKAISK